MKKLMMYWVMIASVVAGVMISPVVSADVNNFSFSSFEGDYYLSRGEDGRSRLRVVETFTADFPDYNQNKGVVRAIPKVYDGHSVSLAIESLTRNGQNEPIYDQTTQNDNLLVSTGDDTYVTGSQTYQLTYTLQDVTKDFGDHQEFYWDTVGTQSSQSFGRVVGRVHLDSSVKDLFAGQTACYEGVQGSTTRCDVTSQGDVYTFSSKGAMQPRENVSMVMRFHGASFAGYSEGLVGVVRQAGAILGIVLSICGVLWAILIRVKRGKDTVGRGTIVPEYLPPKDVSVLFASDFYGGAAHALPAQMIDLAVRKKIQIIEEEKKGIFGSSKKYSVKSINTDNLNQHEKACM